MATRIKPNPAWSEQARAKVAYLNMLDAEYWRISRLFDAMWAERNSAGHQVYVTECLDLMNCLIKMKAVCETLGTQIKEYVASRKEVK